MKAELISTRCGNAVFPRLSFRIELENDEDKHVAIFDISGRVWLHGRGDLGNLTPRHLGNQIGIGSKCEADLDLDLDYRRLEIIEEARKGSDLLIGLEVTPIYYITEGDRFSVSNLRRSSLTVNVKDRKSADHIMIPQSEWVKILDGMGYGKINVMEITIPPPPVGDSIVESMNYLEQAQRSFNDGEYDDVMVDCRKAIEEISKAIDKDTLKDILDSESKAEGVETVKQKIKNKLLDRGAHSGVQFNRIDAELGLHLTQAMIRYLSWNLAKLHTD